MKTLKTTALSFLAVGGLGLISCLCYIMVMITLMCFGATNFGPPPFAFLGVVALAVLALLVGIALFIIHNVIESELR